MISVQWLSTPLVLLGTIFMLTSIVVSVKAFKGVPLLLRRRWRSMTGLIFFFLIGYIFFLFVQINQLPFPLELVTSTIFLGGSIFVFLVINLTRTTILKIKAGDKHISEINEAMFRKNEELVQEIFTRRQAEDKLLTITATANDAIVMVNENEQITFWNKAATRIFGYAEEEAQGRNIHSLLAPNREQQANRPAPTALLPHDTPPGLGRTFENYGLRKDGARIPVEVSLSPVLITGKWHAVGIVKDISERRKAEEQIKASLQGKELLLREIHHMVKNNMQIVSSLLRLQARQVSDRKTIETLESSQNRIMAMALIHETLYQSNDLTNIRTGDYIKNLALNLFDTSKSSPNRVKLTTDIEDVPMGVDTAIPCGLVINELVTNCLKHAFPQGSTGEIKITFRRTTDADTDYQLNISDNGQGLPPELDISTTKSLGLHLVVNLTERQLRGRIEVRRQNGTEFRLAFKEIIYKKRT